jgi:hypothetical protein
LPIVVVRPSRLALIARQCSVDVDYLTHFFQQRHHVHCVAQAVAPGEDAVASQSDDAALSKGPRDHVRHVWRVDRSLGDEHGGATQVLAALVTRGREAILDECQGHGPRGAGVHDGLGIGRSIDGLVNCRILSRSIWHVGVDLKLDKVLLCEASEHGGSTRYDGAATIHAHAHRARMRADQPG